MRAVGGEGHWGGEGNGGEGHWRRRGGEGRGGALGRGGARRERYVCESLVVTMVTPLCCQSPSKVTS